MCFNSFSKGAFPKFGHRKKYSVIKSSTPNFKSLLNNANEGLSLKAVLKNIHPVYTPGMEAAEDYDLWVRLADRATFGNVQKVLLKYRLHPAQLSVIKKKEEEKNVDNIRMKIISGLFKISNLSYVK